MTLIIYASAGHGHKSAALSIEEEIRLRPELGEAEALDSLTITTPLFAKLYPGTYWYMVHYLPQIWRFFYWLFNLKIIHNLDQFLKNFTSRPLKNFTDVIRIKRPDTIIFTHFLGIHNAVQLRKTRQIFCKIHVVVTDFFTHALWINKDVDMYYVMAEETKQDIVKKWGISPEKIKVTGIPISRKFSDSGIKKDRTVLESLGLKKDRLTILFSSGSFGIGPTEKFLNALAPLAQKVQAVIVCGHNVRMKEFLDKEKFAFPVTVLGFVTNMEELMGASDLIVAKPGGVTTCESIIKDLPMVVSSYIPGQEAGNLKLLEIHKACWHLSNNTKQFYETIKSILDNPSVLENKKINLLKLRRPNATKEIVESILKS